MPLQISLASAADEAEADAMLRGSPHALMHYGPAFRGFLARVLPGCSARCTVAREGSRMVGVLPAMTARAGFGAVVNSLPFFGSHGGPWVSERAADGQAAARELLREFNEHLAGEQAVAATIVANPLQPHEELLQAEFGADFHDGRIGQMLRLPPATGSRDGDLEALFAKFHHKTRNAVRKAAKSGFEISHGDEPAALEALAQLHADNIASLGGVVKPRSVFEAVAQSFRYDNDYRVYVARRDGRIGAALLVLFGYGTAEYFVPATLEEYRSLQPMSLLISEAMAESVRRGLRLWNWGGTWESQAGVHMFKSRWGSEDLPYRYYVRLRDRSLLKRRREELLTAYPNFYVLPFSALEDVA